MNKNLLQLLIVDDEVDFAEELQEFLERKNFNVYTAFNAVEAYKALKLYDIDLIILDVKLPGVSGIDVLKKVKAEFNNIEIIIMTGHGDMSTVIDAMRNGAIDFLQKPFTNDKLQIAIERTSKYLELEHILKRSKDKISLISSELEKRIEKNFIGQSTEIVKIHELAMVAAEHSMANVMITGESGTGKEIIARIIHHASDRKEENFCVVNCAAIPNNLLESEFFGHKKGAFTGAHENKKGYFELADGGTLFLDEVAEMSIEMQGKLLRAIEEQKIKRVGDSKIINFNCRIISATNRDIKKAVENNEFRLDLLHRLETLIIQIPALRERVEDIELLLRYFSESFSKKLNKPEPVILKRTVSLLKNYDFPGNVRELKNLVERAIIISKDNSIRCIEDMIVSEQRTPDIAMITDLNIQNNEIFLIKEALAQSENNQTQAAKLLGIDRLALTRRLKKYSIHV
ncbi:MAG: sigma-54-dependent Fis family transcriptional regulator [bacterium]|nr:sigma-54-dependent Fis family transcriptional regulator [bacterium]